MDSPDALDFLLIPDLDIMMYNEETCTHTHTPHTHTPMH